MNFLGMGPLELLVILALALIVFGPGRLPELASQLGRVLAELRRLSAEATAEFQRSFQPPRDPPSRPPIPPPAARSPGPTTSATPPRGNPDEDVLRPPY